MYNCTFFPDRMNYRNPHRVVLVRVQITLAYVEAENHNFRQSLDVVSLFRIKIYMLHISYQFTNRSRPITNLNSIGS